MNKVFRRLTSSVLVLSLLTPSWGFADPDSSREQNSNQQEIVSEENTVPLLSEEEALFAYDAMASSPEAVHHLMSALPLQTEEMDPDVADALAANFEAEEQHLREEARLRLPREQFEFIEAKAAEAREQQLALLQVDQEVAQVRDTLTDRMMAGLKVLDQEIERLTRVQGSSVVAKSILDGHLSVPYDGMTVEYRVIDGIRCPRFLIGEEVFLLVPSHLSQSKHLAQYLARINTEAGAGPDRTGRNVINPNTGHPMLAFWQWSARSAVEKPRYKKTVGRDVTVFFLKESDAMPKDGIVLGGRVYEKIDRNDKSNILVQKRPKFVAQFGTWLYRQYKAKFKLSNFDFNSNLLTISAAMWQATLMSGATKLREIFQDVPYSWTPTAFTFGYAILLAITSPFYRNLAVTLPGPAIYRLTFAAINSVFFATGLAFSFNVQETGGNFFEAFNLMFPNMIVAAGLMTSFFANGYMTQKTREPWLEHYRLRDRTRENSGMISFPIPFRKKLVEWPRSNSEYQFGFYTIPFLINIATIIVIAKSGLHIPFTDIDITKIPGTHLKFPIVPLMFVPLGLYVRQWALRREADKLKDQPGKASVAKIFEEKAKLAEKNRWGRMAKPIAAPLIPTALAAIHGARAIGRVYLKCVNAFRKDKPADPSGPAQPQK